MASLDDSDHGASEPPSDPPEASVTGTGRHTTLPSLSGRHDDDDSLAAVVIRQRGLERRLGRPSYTSSSGKLIPPTGVYAWLEPMRNDLGELLTESRATKKARTGALGWIAARGEKLVDNYLPLLVLGIAAIIARAFHW